MKVTRTMLAITIFLIVGIAAGLGCVSPGSRSVMQFAVTGTGNDPNMQGPTPAAPGGATPSGPAPGAPGGGVSDASKAPAGGAASQMPKDPKLADALKGVRDYEVDYDTTKTRAQLTPKELKDLNVVYAGEESPIAKRTKLLASLDLLKTLDNRYQSAYRQIRRENG